MASKEKLRAKLADARESFTEYEADLSASVAREGILRSELRDVKQKWGQVITERDKLLRQVQQVRVALEPVNKAVNPNLGSFTYVGYGGGGASTPGSITVRGSGGGAGGIGQAQKPPYAQGGVVGTPGAPLPAWWIASSQSNSDPYGR